MLERQSWHVKRKTLSIFFFFFWNIQRDLGQFSRRPTMPSWIFQWTSWRIWSRIRRNSDIWSWTIWWTGACTARGWDPTRPSKWPTETNSTSSPDEVRILRILINTTYARTARIRRNLKIHQQTAFKKRDRFGYWTQKMIKYLFAIKRFSLSPIFRPRKNWRLLHCKSRHLCHERRHSGGGERGGSLQADQTVRRILGQPENPAKIQNSLDFKLSKNKILPEYPKEMRKYGFRPNQKLIGKKGRKEGRRRSVKKQNLNSPICAIWLKRDIASNLCADDGLEIQKIVYVQDNWTMHHACMHACSVLFLRYRWNLDQRNVGTNVAMGALPLWKESWRQRKNMRDSVAAVSPFKKNAWETNMVRGKRKKEICSLFQDCKDAIYIFLSRLSSIFFLLKCAFVCVL